jgi:uncharacterized protein with NRDE domain
MCLILLAHDAHPLYRLVVAANRDEFYERPTAPAAWWADTPHLLAGRDLREGGTWMGVTRTGRFAAVTNVRDLARLRTDAPSRGDLVRGFLLDAATPAEYLDRLRPGADAYNGFNLLVGDGASLHWFSNYAPTPRRLEPGLYGLSNHLLDTPWPKVAGGKSALREVLDAGTAIEPAALLAVLADAEPPSDAKLPDTGVGLAHERVLASRFIASPAYGTRASTVLLVEHGGRATLTERSFLPGGQRWTDVAHEFRLAPAERTEP